MAVFYTNFQNAGELEVSHQLSEICSHCPQDHLYVQYVELVVFQNEFEQLVVRFKENEKIIQDIPVNGSDSAEVNRHLDTLENLMEVSPTLLCVLFLVSS